MDVDYYVSLGGYAYGSLGRSDDVLAPIFAELSKKFVGFVEVLSEVSERVSLTSDADVLRLYESGFQPAAAGMAIYSPKRASFQVSRSPRLRETAVAPAALMLPQCWLAD
ncbi:MAG: hypothetical protein H0T71_13575 [Acidobacteria bacterium]|nr:hypothetical protein [Acidobacteriota bacterium]